MSIKPKYGGISGIYFIIITRPVYKERSPWTVYIFIIIVDNIRMLLSSIQTGNIYRAK